MRDTPTLTGWTLVVLITAVLVSIGTPLLGMRAFHASDVLQVHAPWSEDAPEDFQPQNGDVTDTVDAVLPVRADYRRRAADGDFPLWNPWVGGGVPHGALPNTSTLSPFTLPYLLTPLWYAPGLAKLLEMLVAAGFTYLLCRRLRLGRAAALVGGLAYAFSGFQVVWTNWPQSQVGALIAALFWAVDHAVAPRRHRTSAAGLVPVALVSAAMWLTGFPAVTLWAHVAVAIYALVRVRTGYDDLGIGATPTSSRVGLAAGGLVLGVGLAAVQLVPFAFRLTEVDLGYRVDKDLGALPWRGLLTTVVPDAFGSPPDHAYWSLAHYVELQSYLGVVVLLLVAVAAVGGAWRYVGRGVALFLWVGAGLSTFLIFQGWPLLTLVQAIPVIGTNQIGRLRSLLGFLVAVLAAAGFHALVRRGEHLSGRRFAVPVAIGGLAAAGLAYVAWQDAVAAERTGYLLRELATAGGIGLVAMVAIGLVRNTGAPWLRSAALALLPLLIAAEAVSFARPFWPRIEVEDFYPSTPAHAFLEDNLGSDRIAAGNTAMFPGTAPVYGYRSVTGHALTPPEFGDLLLAVDPSAYDRSRTHPFLAPVARVAVSPILDRMGARYFVVPPVAAPLRDPSLEVVHDRGVVVYERAQALPRIRWASQAEVVPDADERVQRLRTGVDPDVVLLSSGQPQADGGDGDVEVLEDAGDRIRVAVSADGPGHVVIADSIQDAWRATVNGEEVQVVHADHAFGAVAVPAGAHEVELTYAPRGWRLGQIVSGACLLALLGALVASRRGGRSRR